MNQYERVTIKLTPTDKRRGPACYDITTPTLLGRFLYDNQNNPKATLEIIRGADLPWAQQVIQQLEAGHDFWERVV